MNSRREFGSKFKHDYEKIPYITQKEKEDKFVNYLKTLIMTVLDFSINLK